MREPRPPRPRPRPQTRPAAGHTPPQAPPQPRARFSSWARACQTDILRTASGWFQRGGERTQLESPEKSLRKRKDKLHCLKPGARPTLGSAGPRDALSHLPPSKACPTEFLAGRGFCREGPWGPNGSPFLFYLAPTCSIPFNLISPLSPHGVLLQLKTVKTGLDFCNALDMKQPWT